MLPVDEESSGEVIMRCFVFTRGFKVELKQWNLQTGGLLEPCSKAAFVCGVVGVGVGG